MIENCQDWHTIHLAVKQTIMRSYKSNGVQKRGKDFKETQEKVSDAKISQDSLSILEKF